MSSAVGWILGLGCVSVATVGVVRRQWLAADINLAIAITAFAILFMGGGQGTFDILLNSVTLLLIFIPGIFLWTNSGQRFSQAHYLSAGGGKALGGFLLLLGLVGAVGLVGSALP